MHRKLTWIVFVSCGLLFLNFTRVESYDLVVYNATVFDARSGKVHKNRSILVKNGIIVGITNHRPASSARFIDAAGKVVTPSFIDTHIHPADVFGDYANSPQFLPPDSLEILRKRLSDEYLPYGITSVFSMGHRESWIQPLLKWQRHPDPIYVDTFTSGAAITTEGDYIGHTFVRGEQQTRAKVLEYANQGMTYIKLYARILPSDLRTAVKTAESLGMRVYGHIGDHTYDENFATIPFALDAGLRNFEHLVTLPMAVLTKGDWESLQEHNLNVYGPRDSQKRYLEWMLEAFRFADTYRRPELISLITRLGKEKATFSTSIQFLYSEVSENTRSLENFRILMKYATLMRSKGVKLRIGTDSGHGGKLLLGELVLLCENGFSTIEALKIATYNGAKAMGIEDQVGTLDKGKRANFLIWDNNPLQDYHALSGSKSVFKDGIAVKM